MIKVPSVRCRNRLHANFFFTIFEYVPCAFCTVFTSQTTSSRPNQGVLPRDSPVVFHCLTVYAELNNLVQYIYSELDFSNVGEIVSLLGCRGPVLTWWSH